MPMDQRNKAKNVVEALSNLNLMDKKSLVDKMKIKNNQLKKKDNMAVITGGSISSLPMYEQEIALA